MALPRSARPPVTPASSTWPSAGTTWRNPPGRTATPGTMEELRQPHREHQSGATRSPLRQLGNRCAPSPTRPSRRRCSWSRWWTTAPPARRRPQPTGSLATGPTAGPADPGGTAVLPAPGDYALAEAPAGTGRRLRLRAGDWSCDNEDGTPVTGASVTIALGKAWVCTIVNTACTRQPRQTAESAVQDITTGDWTVTYTLNVTNPNPDNADHLRPVRRAPFPAATGQHMDGDAAGKRHGQPGFDGDADQVIATGSPCPQEQRKNLHGGGRRDGHGALPTPDVNGDPGLELASTTSAPSPATDRPTRTKPASNSRTPGADCFQGRRRRPGAAARRQLDHHVHGRRDNPDLEFAAAYMLSDTLVFGGDITVDGSSVVSENGPAVTNPAWTGIAPTPRVRRPAVDRSGRDPQLHGDGERHRWRRFHRGGS